jgi:hypothetical protein
MRDSEFSDYLTAIRDADYDAVHPERNPVIATLLCSGLDSI